jgi:hypothetical protein
MTEPLELERETHDLEPTRGEAVGRAGAGGAIHTMRIV